MSRGFALRRYTAADEASVVELWRRSWQHAYPEIDFSARTAWFRARWRNELVPAATIVIAQTSGGISGFVTIDRGTAYLDQLVVAPESWGDRTAAVLLAQAKRLSPGGITLHVNRDNARALRFYEKHGFVVTGAATNPNSGRPVLAMRWAPETKPG
jgi:putative acetyltransferase